VWTPSRYCIRMDEIESWNSLRSILKGGEEARKK
jgi:hypothetical protein